MLTRAELDHYLVTAQPPDVQRLMHHITRLEEIIALARDVIDGYPSHPPVFGSACPCSLCLLRAALEGR